jgi:hypothetical protein
MMYFKRIFQLLISVLILILASGTLLQSHLKALDNDLTASLSPNIYQSILFIIFWSLMVLALFAAVAFSREMSGGIRVMHLTLALTFVLIGYDKFSTPHHLITLKEQLPISVALSHTQPVNITLRLLGVEKIAKSSDDTIPQYQSTILLNESDTLLLPSNRPVKIGSYRIRLNSWQVKPRYAIIAGEDTLYATSGDSLLISDHYLTVLYPDSVSQLPPLLYKNIGYQPQTNGLIFIEKTPIRIKNAGQISFSTISIIQATKPKIIILLGGFYLLCLIYVLWWKSPK